MMDGEILTENAAKTVPTPTVAEEKGKGEPPPTPNSCANVLQGVETVDVVIERGRSTLQKLDMRDNQTVPIHFSLAVSYGKLNSSTVHDLDDNTKIMIAGAVRKLNKMSEKSWDNAVSNMMQNPVIEVVPDGFVNRSDKVIKRGSNDFMMPGGSPNPATVGEVQTWFKELVNDQDVLDTCKIDTALVTNIVAKSGGTITTFEALFGKRHEYHEHVLVDIGVLRFPDSDDKCFKLYHLKLTAWLNTKRDRTRLTEHRECGITGEYSARKFQPRDSVIGGLNETKRSEVISEAEALFA